MVIGCVYVGIGLVLWFRFHFSVRILTIISIFQDLCYIRLLLLDIASEFDWNGSSGRGLMRLGIHASRQTCGIPILCTAWKNGSATANPTCILNVDKILPHLTVLNGHLLIGVSLKGVIQM